MCFTGRQSQAHTTGLQAPNFNTAFKGRKVESSSTHGIFSLADCLGKKEKKNQEASILLILLLLIAAG